MNNINAVAKPKLSVVIASINARKSAGDCLRALESQRADYEVEIIIVDNSADKTADIIDRDFPHIKLLKAPKNKLIPELWAIGIRESGGAYVALTTTHFVPAKNWIAEIFKIHEQNYAGVGGAIENRPDASLISWAIYFCRYSRYMPPFSREKVADFAADNASYKRVDLESVEHATKEGFWEAFVHKEMLKRKMQLLLTPEIVVYHQESFTFSGFIRQRFQHGTQFGIARGASISQMKRTVFCILSPLIPFIYLYRITNRVATRKRNIDKYVLSLPILFLFLVSWSAGEFNGYLRKSK